MNIEISHSIAIFAQYFHIIYINKMICTSFEIERVFQNDVLFAKIHSCRMKLRQITCFRCIVKIVFESANQSVN